MVSHSYFYHLYLILIPSMKLHWYFQCLLSLFLYLTNHFSLLFNSSRAIFFFYFFIFVCLKPIFNSTNSNNSLYTSCSYFSEKSKPYYIAMVHGTVFSIKGCFGKVCDNILYFECLVLTFSCPPESVFDHQWRAVLLSFLFMSLISQIISHRNVFWSQDYKHFIP